MSKRAEESALKAYPEETRFIRDYNQLAKRQIYQEGYERAEKDYIELAQLWVGSGYANIMSFKQFLKMKLEEG